MDYTDVRRVAITALFSDDTLLNHLVLKGGNALSLVYGLSKRTSLDLDFSMNDDFADVPIARERLFRALRDRFDAVGLKVFDEQLEPKPQLKGEDMKPWWGGYELRFKLIEPEKYEVYKGRLEKLRVNAMVTGPKESRTFMVDLSKFEYTEGKVEREFNSYTIYVYTPEMIVIETLRAICQQMPEYSHRTHQSGRARDFYDIYCAVSELGIDLGSAENLELARRIFAAKEVPLNLLPKINEQRNLHRLDWPAVKDSVAETVKEFNFYFDFLLAQVERLKALWVE